MIINAAKTNKNYRPIILPTEKLNQPLESCVCGLIYCYWNLLSTEMSLRFQIWGADSNILSLSFFVLFSQFLHLINLQGQWKYITQVDGAVSAQSPKICRFDKFCPNLGFIQPIQSQIVTNVILYDIKKYSKIQKNVNAKCNFRFIST